MSIRYWASAVSGTWSVASNWSGSLVPGAGDSVVIDAVPTNKFQPYAVSILSPVTVLSLTIAERNAYVIAQSAISAGAISLTDGHLETYSSIASSLSISGGTLTLDQGASLSGSLTADGGKVVLNGAEVSGSVTWLGGKLLLRAGTVFTNVSWHGQLDPTGSALIVKGGLSLTGASGTGPGQATLAGLTLNQVANLDNATITLTGANANFLVENSPLLTLGSGLVLQNAHAFMSAGDTLVNNGTLNGGSVSGDGFINNGLIEGSFTEKAKHFTNNGTILAQNGAVLELPADFQTKVGPQSQIDLVGGNLVLDGFLATSSLLDLYMLDHISTSGACGFAVAGGLNNSGETLTIGAGSQLGTFYGGATMSVTAGAIDDLGGAELGTLSLLYVNYIEKAAAATLGTATFEGSNFSGAGTVVAQNLTLDQSTLTGVGTLDIGASLDLEGAAISGVNKSGVVDVNFSNGYLSELTIGANQSVKGYAFTFGASGQFGSGAVNLAGGASIDNASFTFDGGFQNSITDEGAIADATLGAHVTTTLLSGELDILGQDAYGKVVNDGLMLINGELSVGKAAGIFSTQSVFQNAGSITVGAGSALFIDPTYGELINSGTISINGGALEATAANLVNHGKLSVTDGTLVLDGPLTLGDLTHIDHPGSELLVNGSLDLGGRSITLLSPALRNLVLSGEVSNGSLSIGAGNTLVTTGFGLFYGATLAAALNNNGTIIATVGLGETDVQTLELTKNVVGHGVIDLGIVSNDHSDFIIVKLDGSVAAGQHSGLHFRLRRTGIRQPRSRFRFRWHDHGPWGRRRYRTVLHLRQR